ncbi:MAG: type II toxin-antitoxin system VapC family toxin [Rhodocyclaceae bacterium]|nr:type II toxin-antitoxin system VapC family toxin [Rhodocyclaceae bacterium]MDZ4214744.1 type II toxin-antitoxin system VapC family toxin [Rhodocyclaceae bacterium]
MGLIYLDACLLIYAAERDPVFGQRILAALASEPDARFAISPLVKLECLVKPIRDGDVVLQQYYEAMLGQLVLLDLPESVYLQAAHMRGRFSLKTPDALHLACAQHHRCDALWTNDNRLAQAGHGLARNILTGA